MGIRELASVLRPLARYKRSLAIGLLLMCGNAVLKLPAPFLTMYLIDVVIPSGQFRLLVSFAVLIVVVSAVFITSELGRNAYMLVLSRKMQASLQLDLLSHVQSLPCSYFRERETGYILSRFLDDVAAVNAFASESCLGAVQQLAVFAVGISAVFYIHWKLALLSIAIIPGLIAVSFAASARLRVSNRLVQERKAVVNAMLHEALAGVMTTRVFGREKYQMLRVFKAAASAIRVQVKTYLATARLSMAMNFLGSLGPLLVLCYGGYEIIHGRLTLGELVAFSGVLGYLYGPGQALTNFYISAQSSLAAFDRIVEVLRMEPEMGLRPCCSVSRPALRAIAGEVVFERVYFGYHDSEFVLSDVSFTVPAGTRVALVGQSGAGKTSLVNLLLRLYEPQRGSIRLDGVDIRSLDVKSLRRTIGLVSQDSYLFNTTVLENICYGDTHASRNAVIHAAQLANAHEFILGLPRGYETIIGSMGCQLSAGQRQRLALARAILKNPTLLILDEATSSVDSQAEGVIWEAIEKLTENRTTFIVSHRLSSILDSETVILLENGKTIDIGSPYELMKSPSYRALFERQFIAGERRGVSC